MTSQINAESGPPATDAWDRLAALAFDQTSAHVGCSAQASACTCRAEHAAHESAPDVPDPSEVSEPSEPSEP